MTLIGNQHIIAPVSSLNPITNESNKINLMVITDRCCHNDNNSIIQGSTTARRQTR